jgi:hypothetical protein
MEVFKIRTFQKHSVFINSTGRTGTQFLAEVMSKMIEDCTSLHEPGTPWISKADKWLGQVKKFGLYHMTLGQLKASHSMFKLSAERIRNNLDFKDIKNNIINMRKDLISQSRGGIYIESSGHIYGLLDILDQVFENSKFIFIIRDPRDWVRSALNTFEYILYGPLDLKFADLSIKASDLPEDEYYESWNEMSMFEKYCWYYNKLNSFVLSQMEGRNNFEIYRHEDLFSEETRDQTFVDMLKFAAEFPDGFKRNIDYKSELMDEKIHSNAEAAKTPPWQDWNKRQAEIVEKHCGSWMRKFNYGGEKNWLEKI